MTLVIEAVGAVTLTLTVAVPEVLVLTAFLQVRLNVVVALIAPELLDPDVEPFSGENTKFPGLKVQLVALLTSQLRVDDPP